MKYVLAETVTSVFRSGDVYGKMNDKVTVIAKHGDVSIVENENKNRFAVRKEQLKSESEIEPAPVKHPTPIEKPVKSNPRKRKAKSEPQGQSNMF